MTEKAAAAQKRRKVKMTVATALATVLVLGLGTFLVITLTKDDGAATAAGNCSYPTVQNQGTSANPNIVATGPPSTTAPNKGTEDFTMQLTTGDVVVQMDLNKAPCTSNSFAFLSSKNYFTGSTCHRLTTENLYVLQCGDPSGTGSGGPSYTVADENLPEADPTTTVGSYPAGTVAMAEGSNSDPGSQFFIVYKDTELPANYTRVGFVKSGLKVISDIAAKGAVDSTTGKAAEGGDGAPKDTVTINGTTMSEPDPNGIPVNPWTQPADGSSGSPSTTPSDS